MSQDKLELTEDGHIVAGVDDEGYPIIIGTVIWHRTTDRLPVKPFQGFTTIGKSHAFAAMRDMVSAYNSRAADHIVDANKMVEGVEYDLGQIAGYLIHDYQINNSPNFRTHTAERDGQKYSITIQREYGVTPSEKIAHLEATIENVRDMCNKATGMEYKKVAGIATVVQAAFELLKFEHNKAIDGLQRKIRKQAPSQPVDAEPVGFTSEELMEAAKWLQEAKSVDGKLDDDTKPWSGDWWSRFHFALFRLGTVNKSELRREIYRFVKAAVNATYPDCAPKLVEAAGATVDNGWFLMPPNDGSLHMRGLEVRDRVTGHTHWEQYSGYIHDESGDFQDEDGDNFGWDANDYTHWKPVDTAPPAETGGEGTL